MSRKGLLREISGCCFPGRQERNPPHLGSVLHFPVTNITARHHQDCHIKPALSSQTAPQYLQVKSLMLTAVLWELTAPELQRQLSAGWDWAFPPPGPSRGNKTPMSCCQKLLQPQQSQGQPWHKPRKARSDDTGLRRCLHRDDTRKSTNHIFGCKQPLRLFKVRPSPASA